MSGKILILELAKMLSANQFSGFLNQLYLKKKLTNQLDLWHADIGSRNLRMIFKVLVGHSQKYFRLIRF